MSSIEYVVRNAAGALQRGFVAGESGSPLILAQAGSDISLNLQRSMIAGYRQDGDNLRIALSDGREILIDGYFDAAGQPVADLFISADGALAKVDLAAGADGTQFATYSEQDAFGKWSPEDDLYFVGSDTATVAAPYVDDEVGMLAAGLPLLGGMGLPLLGLLGLGAGTAVLGGGEEREEPSIDVAFTTGTWATGTVVNGEDQKDGATITGTGTPGGTVTVEVGGHTRTTVVDDDGLWSVVFPPAEVPRGDYEQEITLTITKGDLTKTVTDILDVDTEVAVTFDAAVTGGEGIVNAVEQDGRVQLSGTVDAGATVSVLINGQTFAATVSGTTWTLLLPDGFLAEGDYLQEAVVTATDEYDNTSTVRGTFAVDTELQVGFDAVATGGNGVVNAVEQGGKVILSGSVDADATSVIVTLNGTDYTATVSGSSWSVELPEGVLPTGETFSQEVTVRATDDAGNTAMTSGSFTIDTELDVTIAPTGAGGDLIVNDAEQGGSVRVQGTVDADARSVRITVNGADFDATVADGAWTVDLPAGFLPGDDAERTLDIQVQATDVNGNVATTAGTVEVDTWVNRLAFTGAAVGGDGMVNRGEALSAITLAGVVEHDAGLGRLSTVDVVFRDDSGAAILTRAATVTGGSWSVSFAPGEIPQGEYGAAFEVIATDHAGNVRRISQEFEVDTTPPEAPLIESYTRSGDGVRAFSVETTDETIEIDAVAGDGTVASVDARAVTNPFVADETIYDFSSAPVPNGSHLVMTSTDAAGNATSTLFALEETLTNTINVGNAGLDGFNIEAIDLQFAEDSELTLTPADLESLCAHSNHLTVHGGADDTVNILGAVETGTTETIGGRTYAVYSFGDAGGTLAIDEVITVNT